MNGVDHPLDGPVKQALSLLVVTTLDQRRRADHVGEEDGDLLALPFEGVAADLPVVRRLPGRLNDG